MATRTLALLLLLSSLVKLDVRAQEIDELTVYADDHEAEEELIVYDDSYIFPKDPRTAEFWEALVEWEEREKALLESAGSEDGGIAGDGEEEDGADERVEDDVPESDKNLAAVSETEAVEIHTQDTWKDKDEVDTTQLFHSMPGGVTESEDNAAANGQDIEIARLRKRLRGPLRGETFDRAAEPTTLMAENAIVRAYSSVTQRLRGLLLSLSDEQATVSHTGLGATRRRLQEVNDESSGNARTDEDRRSASDEMATVDGGASLSPKETTTAAAGDAQKQKQKHLVGKQADAVRPTIVFRVERERAKLGEEVGQTRASNKAANQTMISSQLAQVLGETFNRIAAKAYSRTKLSHSALVITGSQVGVSAPAELDILVDFGNGNVWLQSNATMEQVEGMKARFSSFDYYEPDGYGGYFGGYAPAAVSTTTRRNRPSASSITQTESDFYSSSSAARPNDSGARYKPPSSFEAYDWDSYNFQSAFVDSARSPYHYDYLYRHQHSPEYSAATRYSHGSPQLAAAFEGRNDYSNFNNYELRYPNENGYDHHSDYYYYRRLVHST